MGRILVDFACSRYEVFNSTLSISRLFICVCVKGQHDLLLLLLLLQLGGRRLVCHRLTRR